MTTIAETFALAFKHHQTGNLQQAEHLYRQILMADPGHADAHHLLGALAYQLGRYEKAIALIRQAISVKPDAAGYHSNLGLAYQGAGHMDEAIASFREALRIQPDAPEAHSNLANGLLRQEKRDEAVVHYRLALRLRPDYADAHCGLGVALDGQGQPEEAVIHFRKAVKLDPNLAEAHSNLGNLLLTNGSPEEAVVHCREALRLRPSYAEAENNLGNALQTLGHLDQAVAHFGRALELRPDFPEAHWNLGNALKILGKVDQAVAQCKEAVRLRPDSAEAHNSLGNALVNQGNLEEGIAHFDRALKISPDYSGAHNNLGIALMCQGKKDDALSHFEQALRLKSDLPEDHYERAILWLLRGNYEQGWPEYEWRWKRTHISPRPFDPPLWDGSRLNHQTILLHAEQGLGDTLQFIRFAQPVKEHGGRVIVECHPELMPLLKYAKGINQLVGRGSPLPAFDVHAPLLSLPGILHVSRESIPASIPYLQADMELVKHWRRELRESDARSPMSDVKSHSSDLATCLSPLAPRFKIGIAWQGNKTYRADRQRSIPLEQFKRLADLPGVRLISLQKGPGAEQLSDNWQLATDNCNMLDFADRLDRAAGAFMDTAAVIKNLDLVITSDTAVAHLAGALGVPVWVALAVVPDWRWLLERADSPWYPTMRLFRQTRYGRWDDVFERMAAALMDLKPDHG
jgi:tetratricopeptide (TPR) repeat protein